MMHGHSKYIIQNKNKNQDVINKLLQTYVSKREENKDPNDI